MIRTVIFDIGNVLAGFAWHEYYEKLGFEKEGCKRMTTVRNGRYVDEYVMARLRPVGKER